MGRRLLKVATVFALVLMAWFARPAFTAEVEIGGYYEGAPQFTIFPQVLKAGDPGEPFDVLISFHSKYVTTDQVARGRLELGKGLQLVAGSSTHTAHVSKSWKGPNDNLWRVRLRATVLGQFEMRASVVADVGSDRRDESVSLLVIDVSKTGVSGLPRPLRKETIRNGQRYRYDAYLVPIDGPEEIVAAEIAERAKPIYEEIGRCSGCGAGEYRVPFVVFLNPAGRVRSYRALTSGPKFKPASPEVTRAAEKALLKWKFSPSRTRDRAVAGWTLARVTVRSQR